MKPHRWSTALFFLLFFAVTVQARNADVPAVPGAFTHTARSPHTGAWTDAASWTNNQVPALGAVVRIPAGSNITLTGDSARIKWIEVEGTLTLANNNNSHLWVETLYVAPNGLFTLPTPALPVGNTAEVTFIVFPHPVTGSRAIDTAWDPQQMSRGLVAEGRVKLYGAPRSYQRLVVLDAPKQTSTIRVDAIGSLWQDSDELVVTASFYRRAQPLQAERRRIAQFGINAATNTITLTSPFTYDHLRVTSGGTTPNLHVANLTRNIRFNSENAAPTYERGHVMLMHWDTDIQNASFTNLGRTDKKVPLNDVTFVKDAAGRPTGSLIKPAPGAVTNKRGRYAVHVHETWENSGRPLTAPTTPRTKIHGCVVDGTPGWAFVNHSSDVDFRRNVAYNFDGAGFVTEDGDELGNFINNIAIKGNGNGEYRKDRVNFMNNERPQAIADFAFTGVGFWFNGPAVRVNGAVSNSCNGDGMIWHTTGAVNFKESEAFLPAGNKYPWGRYTYFPEDWRAAVFGSVPGYSSLVPRRWKEDATRVNISDLPILQCDNVESYANLVGFRLRFNNFDNVDWYNETPFRYDLHIASATADPAAIRTVPGRLRQIINNVKAWNNEAAVNIRYAGHTDWNTIFAVSRLDHDGDELAPYPSPATFPNYGMEIHFRIDSMTMSNLTVDGYEVAYWKKNPPTANPADITFLTTPVVSNYIVTDVWKKADVPTCGVPAPVVTGAGTSRTIQWSATANAVNYFIRYRINEPGRTWQFVPRSTDRIVTINNLVSGKPYVYQVIAGCTLTPSLWSNAGTF